MAAIDKLRFKSYSEFQLFIKWVIAYYPKMLFDIYDWKITEEEWDMWKENIYQDQLKGLMYNKKMCGFELDEDVDMDKGIINLIKFYKEQNYDCPYDQALLEVSETYDDDNNMRKNKSSHIRNIELPVANFRWDDDIVLKWRCPIGEIRDYLHNQCGVNPKKEWIYKLYFKGKKYC